jgi:hypothetical protein
MLTVLLSHEHKARGPLRVLVKEVTNKVLPALTAKWAQLAHVVLVVIRNPMLQLESRLRSILDRIGSGPFGLHARPWDRGARTTADRWCRDSRHGNNMGNSVKRSRDYSLGWRLYTPFAKNPSVRRSCGVAPPLSCL